jgi:hypothetical protein
MVWEQVAWNRFVRKDGAVVMWDQRSPHPNPVNPRSRMWTAWEPDPSQQALTMKRGRVRRNNSFQWIGLSRGHRIVEKWAPTHRFYRFRAAWIPDHLQNRVYCIRGTKEEMVALAAGLAEFAFLYRQVHALTK